MPDNAARLSTQIEEVTDLARCMVDSLKDTKKVTSDSFSDDLIRQLNQSIYHAEALLAPLKNPSYRIQINVLTTCL